MSESITGGSTVITPTLVLGYQSTRETRNIIHPILGREDPDVTYRPANLRTGTLRLLFGGGTTASGYAIVGGYIVPVGGSTSVPDTDSKTAEDALCSGEVFTLNSSVGSVEMLFVVTGSVRRELDPQTRRAWVVEFDYQEVSA